MKKNFISATFGVLATFVSVFSLAAIQSAAAGSPKTQQNKKSSIKAGAQPHKTQAGKYHLNRCAEFVGNAIEAGGIPLNRGLNPSPRNSAYGYGPVLENAGFTVMPKGTKPQAGDVAIFPPVPNHPHGHATMFDGKLWKSDFKQKDIYASQGYRKRNAPYTLYRRP